MFAGYETKSLSIDKSGWKKVKFGDVAFEPKESSKDPVAEGVEHVVGLEHIDSEDIHLRRSSGIEEATTFTKKFKSGDVLFGRRRAYLKKAAQAKFEGICSGDITVLRANENILLPSLLPFIVNNDNFFDHAITHSAGGLSPRVKFKDLAKLEILVPNKDLQEQYSELLWSMDNVIESDIRLLERAQIQFETIKNSLLLQGLSNEPVYSKELKFDVAKDWSVTTVAGLIDSKTILAVQDGNHGELHPKSRDYIDDGIPFIMANVLHDGKIDFNEAKKLPQSITDRLRIGFSISGDVLLSHKGTVGEVALVPDNLEWPYLMLTPQVTYYRVDHNKIMNRFLYYVFTSRYFQNQLKSSSSQSTRAYIGITAQKDLKIVIPPSKKEQADVVATLDQLEGNLGLINNKIKKVKHLQKALSSKVF